MGCGGSGNGDKPSFKLKSPPPFEGTIFITPQVFLDSDPSSFSSISYQGQFKRSMFDRRVDRLITDNAFVFLASFDDGKQAEVRVNSEFVSVEKAEVEGKKYAWFLGQLPAVLRKDVKTITIHKGIKLFGGGEGDVLIHTGKADEYSKNGILVETLAHEAAHVSLDADHAKAQAWKVAQQKDQTFISTYARDHVTREDIAESFLPYLAVTYRKERIDPGLATLIEATIPNRINYFSIQQFELYPFN